MLVLILAADLRTAVCRYASASEWTPASISQTSLTVAEGRREDHTKAR